MAVCEFCGLAYGTPGDVQTYSCAVAVYEQRPEKCLKGLFRVPGELRFATSHRAQLCNDCGEKLAFKVHKAWLRVQNQKRAPIAQ